MVRVTADLPYTLRIDGSWETPATKYPLGKIGRAEITRKRQSRGLYRMEAVCGYLYYKLAKPIMVTSLKIRGRIWMVDDPLHWFGMKELAKYSEGKVLVGGLGLGLIVHALLENKNVADIDVVEFNHDVTNLVTPHLPKTERLRIYEDNVFSFDPRDILSTPKTDFGDYKTVILDVWTGRGTTEMLRQMLSSFAHMKWQYHNANVVIWGHGAHWLNPSVDEEVSKMITKDYWVG